MRHLNPQASFSYLPITSLKSMFFATTAIAITPLISKAMEMPNLMESVVICCVIGYFWKVGLGVLVQKGKISSDTAAFYADIGTFFPTCIVYHFLNNPYLNNYFDKDNRFFNHDLLKVIGITLGAAYTNLFKLVRFPYENPQRKYGVVEDTFLTAVDESIRTLALPHNTLLETMTGRALSTFVKETCKRLVEEKIPHLQEILVFSALRGTIFPSSKHFFVDYLGQNLSADIKFYLFAASSKASDIVYKTCKNKYQAYFKSPEEAGLNRNNKQPANNINVTDTTVQSRTLS